MTAIRAILFDMDGVLVDAGEWHYQAFNQALSLFGMGISRDQQRSTFDGLPTREKLKILSASHGLPAALHEFLNHLKQKYTEQIITTRCRPISHIQYAVSRLHSDGYRIAVCSNSIRSTVSRMMDLSGLEQYLEFFLSNEDVTRPKPDSEMYNAAMKRLGMLPGQCLIVEDNVNGIRAARDSGGHVMEVGGVNDVTYERISARIFEVTKSKEGVL